MSEELKSSSSIAMAQNELDVTMVAAERLTQEIFLDRGNEGSRWRTWGASSKVQK
jgi:hypothetical protein